MKIQKKLGGTEKNIILRPKIELFKTKNVMLNASYVGPGVSKLVICIYSLHCDASPMYLRSLSLLGCVWRKEGECFQSHIQKHFWILLSKNLRDETADKMLDFRQHLGLGWCSTSKYQIFDNHLRDLKGSFLNFTGFFPSEAFKLWQKMCLVLSLVKAVCMS